MGSSRILEYFHCEVRAKCETGSRRTKYITDTWKETIEIMLLQATEELKSQTRVKPTKILETFTLLKFHY